MYLLNPLDNLTDQEYITYMQTPDLPDIKISCNLSIPLLVTYLKRGIKQAEIARICNVSRQAVNEYIHNHFDQLAPLIDKDDSVLANTFKHITNKAATKITAILDEECSKKDLVALNMVMGTTADKYRVFSNQTTANIGIKTIVSDLEERKRQLLDAINVTPEEI